jgi:hypothetical protein
MAINLDGSGQDVGSGGGTGGTGGTGTGSAGVMAAASAPTAARPAQSNVLGLRVRVAVADVPVRCSPERILPGERVYITPLSGNTKVVRVALTPSGCIHGPYDEVGPTDAEREFPVDNTGFIWIMQSGAGFVLNEGIAVKPRKSA